MMQGTTSSIQARRQDFQVDVQVLGHSHRESRPQSTEQIETATPVFDKVGGSCCHDLLAFVFLYYQPFRIVYVCLFLHWERSYQ